MRKGFTESGSVSGFAFPAFFPRYVEISTESPRYARYAAPAIRTAAKSIGCEASAAATPRYARKIRAASPRNTASAAGNAGFDPY